MEGLDSTWAAVVAAATAEFSDLAHPGDLTSAFIRLLMASLLTGAVGLERERHDASAGLRTHMLVGVGATLFVMVPALAGASLDSLSRVVQGLLTGIGFLGAGAIFRLDGSARVRGLTTAASIWAVASIGMAVGLGRGATALLGTLFVLVILTLLKRVDARIERDRERRLAESRRAAAVVDLTGRDAGAGPRP